MFKRHSVAIRWQPPRWSFRPRLVPSLATAVLLPILLALGLWQTERAAYKQDLVVQMQQRLQQAALTQLPSGTDVETQRFRRLVLNGRFDAEGSFLLDNRTYRGRAGFHLYTPLRTADGRAILVNRGWMPLIERSRLPEPPPRPGPVSVEGFLDTPPASGLALGETLADATDPPLAQNLDPQRIQAMLGYPLHPLVLFEQDSGDPALIRDWQPGSMGPARHLAYAFQWFALAASLAVIFVVVNLRRTHH